MLVAFFALIALGTCEELSIFLKPRKRFCFHEFLSAGDEISGSVVINPATLYQVRFTINTPGIKGMVYSTTTPSDSYAVSITKTGTYHFCFEASAVETPSADTDEPKQAASRKDLLAMCDFTLDVARASSPASIDRFSATIDQAHKVMSSVQADQRYSKYRENRLIDGLSSVSRKLWIFIVFEILIVIGASAVQMGMITTMHKRSR